jgi:hypothetical protein
MARKTGQLIAHGTRTWFVRVSLDSGSTLRLRAGAGSLSFSVGRSMSALPPSDSADERFKVILP